jgi:YbbR domain-containing protein
VAGPCGNRRNVSCADIKQRIDISKLPPGVYTINVIIDNEYLSSEKLVIVR